MNHRDPNLTQQKNKIFKKNKQVLNSSSNTDDTTELPAVSKISQTLTEVPVAEQFRIQNPQSTIFLLKPQM